MLIIRNCTKQWNRKNITYIFHGHHVTAFHHIHAKTVNDQLCLFYFICFQKSDDTICIADCGYLRCGNNDGTVSTCDRIFESLLNTCRAIQKDIIKLFSEFIGQFLHLLRRNRCLVSCLCRRQQI